MRQNLENKKSLKVFSFSLVKMVSLIAMVCLMVGILVACKNEKTKPTEETTGDVITYNVTVMSEGGMALKDVRVVVYKDSSRSEMVGTGMTNKDGKMSFSANESKKYVIALEEVPKGYEANESYEVKSGEVELLVKTKLEMVENLYLSAITYELGDIMNDFEVTTIDGEKIKLSELLKTKKAVVLNFWYLDCNPCKMEFPFMQEAYEDYKDDIAIIAMNPMDSNIDDIKAFRDEKGLSFYMASVDYWWQHAFSIRQYPTTIVIDKYGMISMRHESSITSKADFVKFFTVYTAEGYKQSIVDGISTR